MWLFFFNSMQRYKYYSDKQNIYYKINNKLINIMKYINKFEITEEFNQAIEGGGNSLI